MWGRSSGWREVWGEGWVDQSEPVSGCGVQVWLDCESECGDSREGAGASAGFGGDWAGVGIEGCFAVDCGWIELSGDAECAAAD